VEENEFLSLAATELARLDAALEKLQDAGVAEFDFEVKPGGIIEIEFDDGSKIIVNRHTAAREIWVAARSGGFHFSPPREANELWLGTRDGEDLATVLSRCISEQAGAQLRLDW
jgi:CyaY protein